MPPEPENLPAPEPYRIHWRNRSNGRNGIGTKEFCRADALELADQLNEEYPDIEHAALPVNHGSDGVITGTEFNRLQPPESAPQQQPVQRKFKPLSDMDLFPNFGPHARKIMRSVPADYLDYLRGQPQLMRAWPELADYIERNKKAIAQDVDRMDR